MKKILLFVFLFFFTIFQSQATWIQTAGPTGGKVTCLKSLGTAIYAGTPNGVFVSINGGLTWAKKVNGMATTDVLCLETIGSTIFAGTRFGEVYASSNGGTSWNSVHGNLVNHLPNGCTVFTLAADGTSLYAGTDGTGVYRTTDNGANWSAVNSGFLSNNNVVSIAIGSGVIFAATYGNGIFMTTNNAVSWAPVQDVSFANSYLATIAVNGSTLYASEVGTSGYFKSTNNGNSFSNVSSAFPLGTYIRSFLFNGSTIVVGTVSDGLFKSTNNGTNWTAATTGLISSQICGIYALALSGTNIIAGSDGCGIYISTNNASSWNPSNTNLFNTEVDALCFNGTSLFAGLYGVGIYKSDDEGATWINTSSSYPIYNTHAIASLGGSVFVGYDYGVYRSDDNGATWVVADNGLPFLSPVYSFVTSGVKIYAGTTDGVYMTSDGGLNWNQVSSGIPSGSEVRCLAISGSNIYAGATYASTGVGLGIYRSQNNGTSWTQVYSNSFFTYLSLAANGTNVYAGVENGGMVMSSNNGTSWNAINNGFSTNFASVYSIISIGTNIFAGTNEGMYRSNNNGANWTPINSGFPSLSIPYLKSLTYNGSFIFGGTDNSAVWKNGLNSLLAVPICLVTVDETSSHNVIIWEKDSLVTTIDSFRVYREDITNVYTYIASVGFNELSQYTDTSNTANPNFVSRRYRIATVDNNHVVSSQSPFHRTMLLTNTNDVFQWNEYEIEGQVTPVQQYKLMRDDNGTGNFAQIASTTGTTTTIVAPNWINFQNSPYRIDTDLGSLVCTPTQKVSTGYSSTRSNIKNRNIGIHEVADLSSKVFLKPNPASEMLTISYAVPVTQILIYDYLGRVVLKQSTENSKPGSTTLNLSKIKTGIYTVISKGKDFEVRKKLVVQ